METGFLGYCLVDMEANKERDSSIIYQNRTAVNKRVNMYDKSKLREWVLLTIFEALRPPK